MISNRACTHGVKPYLIVYVVILCGYVAAAFSQDLTAEIRYDVRAVQPGDCFKANMVVHGCSYNSTSIVPFEVMLAIDMSASMVDNDPQNMRLVAASDFVSLCSTNSPTAAGNIPVGIVSFRKNARKQCELTTEYTLLQEKISEMYSQGLGKNTNIAAAMVMAHSELRDRGYYPTKVVILLTDGMPTPDGDMQEQMVKTVLIGEALTAGIRYYTIGLGATAWDMAGIAGKTGGQHWSSVVDSELASIFDVIFQEIGKELVASKINLHIELDDNVRFHGGLEVPPRQEYPADDQIENFYENGFIDYTMPPLRDIENGTLSFDLLALGCLSVDNPHEEIEITPMRHPLTEITYNWGTQRITYIPNEEKILCLRPGSLQVKKNFYPDSSIVELLIINNFTHHPNIPDEDRTFENLRIIEWLTSYFQFCYDGPPGYYIATYPSSNPDYIKPRCFIPFGNRDIMFWNVANLAPQETVRVWYSVDTRAWAPDHSDTRLAVDCLWKGESARIYYDYGDQKDALKYIPPEYYLPPMLPDLGAEGGRPDLYLEPALSYTEFCPRYNVPIPGIPSIDELAQDPRIPPTGPWPLTFNILKFYESRDIFIDSKTNGYVTNWSRRQHVKEHIEHAKFRVTDRVLLQINGQGDLFRINEDNRIYFNVKDVATASTANGPISADVYVLIQQTDVVIGPPRWDSLHLQAISAQTSFDRGQLYFFELPAGTIQPNVHTRRFGIWGDNQFDVAEIMIKVVPAENEVHTSNNISVERFLVKP